MLLLCLLRPKISRKNQNKQVGEPDMLRLRSKVHKEIGGWDLLLLLYFKKFIGGLLSYV